MNFSGLPNERRLVALAGILGATGILAGAFGAHALEVLATASPDATLRLNWWRTGAHYHLVHALAVALAGWRSGPDGRLATVTGLAFALGVFLFSGSLYAMALGGPRVLGAVTPIGGLCFVAGWISVAIGALRQPNQR